MIELQFAGPRALLHIRRADKKNALTSAMWQALLDHCTTLSERCTAGIVAPAATRPRVLLLSGEPGTFCAGADIEELTRLVQLPDALRTQNELIDRAQRALEALPIPTIAVIDGPCIGGGVGLAGACDFRLGSTRSSFAVTPARLGLLYSLNDTRRLTNLVGFARARRLLLRGERLDAAAALAWGVLDEVVAAPELQARADAWAGELAAQSPTSMAGIKATLAHLASSCEGSNDSIGERFAAAFDGLDFKEGAAAFLQRRSPRF